jgi:hypothetical protein
VLVAYTVGLRPLQRGLLLQITFRPGFSPLQMKGPSVTALVLACRTQMPRGTLPFLPPAAKVRVLTLVHTRTPQVWWHCSKVSRGMFSPPASSRVLGSPQGGGRVKVPSPHFSPQVTWPRLLLLLPRLWRGAAGKGVRAETPSTHVPRQAMAVHTADGSMDGAPPPGPRLASWPQLTAVGRPMPEVEGKSTQPQTHLLPSLCPCSHCDVTVHTQPTAPCTRNTAAAPQLLCSER